MLIRCDLGIDADLSGVILAAYLTVKAYPRSLIVDVNNGLVNGLRRNADITLDPAERNDSGYGPNARDEPLRL